MNYIEIFQDLQLFKIFQVLQRSFKIFKKCSTWEVPIRSSGNKQVLSQLFDNYFFFLGGEGGSLLHFFGIFSYFEFLSAAPFQIDAKISSSTKLGEELQLQ